MSNTSNASKNVKRFLLLFALGIAYGFMYVMPYMKSSFYDQMIAAMGCIDRCAMAYFSSKKDYIARFFKSARCTDSICRCSKDA